MSLSHILAPEEASAPDPPPDNSTTADVEPATMPSASAQQQSDEHAADTPKTEGGAAEENTSPNGQHYASTTTSTRRNASGSVSSVYSGNKIRHLKKEDGIPLWRKDIQYDFLHAVFSDETRCFTKYSDGSQKHTFAEIYIDAMAKSSKCSKILKEKLLQDTDGAACMAMVCLLVNVGRMNTTLNFFPEMRAQLRTYHSIPALQAHQDPNAYKQLQDAPRLKSILKGATEDEPQPSTIEEIKAARIPRTNPVNLIFVMSQFAPKVSEAHFPPPRDFFDLVMRNSLSSESRANAFLWLIWWHLESDFTAEASQQNPFGKGQYPEGKQESGAMPVQVPTLKSLTEAEAAAENVDTEEETYYGEVKKKERIAILASEPSPAMTALKRARKEKGLISGGVHGIDSDDDVAPQGRAGRLAAYQDNGSDYTRSPSPAASRGFQAVNTKPPGDMRINNLLNNDDAISETSPPRSAAGQAMRKGPGRGNWRSKQPRPSSGLLPAYNRPQEERSHHVPLAPNLGQLNFVNDGPAQPGSTQSGFHTITSNNVMPSSFRDHVPTPSYQAQKRHRGVTQHQNAVQNHRKQQIEYTLDKKIRKVHIRARREREKEGALLRAWKRIRRMPTDYDSEEEEIKIRKAKEKSEKDDDWRSVKGKENVDALEDGEPWRRARVHLAGFVHVNGETPDIGEETKAFAQTFRRCWRRLERWEDSQLPGNAMIRRRQIQAQGLMSPHRRRAPGKELSMEQDGMEVGRSHSGRGGVRRQRSGTGRTSERRDDIKMELDPDDEDGGGELDEEDRELLGEVDADETEDDDSMGDD